MRDNGRQALRGRRHVLPLRIDPDARACDLHFDGSFAVELIRGSGLEANNVVRVGLAKDLRHLVVRTVCVGDGPSARQVWQNVKALLIGEELRGLGLHLLKADEGTILSLFPAKRACPRLRADAGESPWIKGMHGQV